MTLGFRELGVSKQILRSITKDVSRKAEKIAKDKLNERLARDSSQSIELDFQHSFQISGDSAKISFHTSYEKIKGEQRERVRGYSYRNKNGKTVHVSPHNRVNKDTRKFQTENGDFFTSDEIPEEVYLEVFTEAVQEALTDAFKNLKV